jgi:OmpA-OmpF porin, OOP family
MPLTTPRLPIWNPGPTLIAVIWSLAYLFGIEGLERDVLQRAEKVLSSTVGLVENPELTIQGRDITVSGLAFTKEGGDALLDALSHVRGVRLVVSNLGELPKLDGPLSFSAVMQEGLLKLSGHVSLPGVRSNLVQAAHEAMAGAVVDDISYAQGAGPGFQTAARHGLLQAARLENGRFTLTNMVYGLSGRAEDEKIYDEVTAALRRLPPGVVAGDIRVERPLPGPPEWRVTRDKAAVEISGPVGTDAERKVLIAATRASLSSNVIDHLRLSRASAGREGAQLLDVALGLLSQFSAGEVTMRDGAVLVEGMAKPGLFSEDLRLNLSAKLPSGWSLGRFSVTESDLKPFRFSAEKVGGSIRLAGHLPGKSAHARVRDLVARFAPGLPIIDESRLASGAPMGMVEALAPLISGLSRLTEGRAMIEDQVASLRGEAFYQGAALAIVSEAQTILPPTFRFDSTLRVQDEEPPLDKTGCQAEINSTLRIGPILFDTGEAILDVASLAILDPLVATLRRCATFNFIVAGHTDASGSPDFNADLSLRRAQALVSYLEGEGIPLGRMSPSGLGASQPVAPNDSDAGRAANRRIEILVR